MATTYTLTTAPTTVSANGMTGGALIRAVGGTVYAGDDPGTGPTDGMPVYAGETCTWDPGRPLYLTGASGASAVVDYNSGSSVFPAAGVASQLISQNLPDLIAQRIAINGAPPIDAPVVLHNLTSPSQFTSYPWLGFAQDVHTYQSLDLNISFQDTRTTKSPGDVMQIKILFSIKDSSGNSYAVSRFTFESAGESTIFVTVPVTGTYVQVTFATTGDQTKYTYTDSIIGSYRSCARPFGAISNVAWSNKAGVIDKMLESRYTALEINTQPASSSDVSYPSYCTGPMSISFGLAGTNANASGVSMYLQNALSLATGITTGSEYGLLNYTANPPSTPTVQQDFYLPGQPKLTITNSNTNVQIPFIVLTGEL